MSKNYFFKGDGEIMTEQEFSVEARKRGVSDDNISSTLKMYYEMKKHKVNITLDIFLEIVVKAQTDIDNNPHDSISAD